MDTYTSTKAQQDRRKRFTGNGMIQPGAHPEFETNKTPLDRTAEMFHGFSAAWDKAMAKIRRPKPKRTANPY